MLTTIETVILPLPSEIELLLTGFNVSTGSFFFPAAIVVTTTGSLVGASPPHAGGYFFSEERLDHLTSRFGRSVGISTQALRKIMSWLDRYGSALVSFGRLVSIIRSLVSIPAGPVEMSFAKLHLWTTLRPKSGTPSAFLWDLAVVRIGISPRGSRPSLTTFPTLRLRRFW